MFRWVFWSLRLGRGSGGGGESSGGGRVALGYHTLGFISGAIWTVGSCQIQRQQAEAAEHGIRYLHPYLGRDDNNGEDVELRGLAYEPRLATPVISLLS
ncbi:hypothetical protein F3Y22_tig00009942pilonHSYRG00304 [Hibiscus syriacus]|uniref:Uncharacterized protein n=1 Tax=Hibiscus syriacus TaxID=106335 RepID=A0A6A3C6P6_HIBSY|nr:hypothetical protein F3Y22_tig00009942pilonHSYRG00304 [Hibiscus syriacus]